MQTMSSSNAQVKLILVLLLTLLVYPGISQIYLIKDINDLTGQSGGPLGFIQRGNLLYFIANDGVHGQELWRTNGSSTYQVKDINPGSAHGLVSPPRMAVCYGKLYFLANDGQHGTELWSTFQSTAIMVEDLRPGNNSNHIFYLTVVNNMLLFQASPVIGDLEWWKANAGNTVEIVKDIRPGDFGAQLKSPSVGLDLIFFGANDGGVIGEQLWVSSGTEAGTRPIADRRVGIGQGVEYNNSVYLMLEALPNDGFELFRADASGAVMVKNINTEEFGSSQPKAIDFHGMVYKGYLYFNAYEPSHGDALWKTDGTTQGTTMVKDIYPGSDDNKGYIGVMKVFNDFLYFTADDGTPGLDLWRSDGTESGTIKVKDFAGGIVGNFHQLEEKLYFIGNDGIHGNELWETDGTEEGTTLVQDFYPGPSLGVYEIMVFEDKIYLGASDGTLGYELYAYAPYDCIGPEITGQPSGGTFGEGGNITLTVNATGDGLTYQWQKYYEDIPGAINSTLSILNINPSDAGEYTCRVKNSCTTVTSAEASVVVGVPTGLQIFPHDESNVFAISPNPANQWIKIEKKDPGTYPETVISVFNMKGVLLIQDKLNRSHLLMDVAGLPPGLYIVLFQTSGLTTKSLKLTIQR